MLYEGDYKVFVYNDLELQPYIIRQIYSIDTTKAPKR